MDACFPVACVSEPKFCSGRFQSKLLLTEVTNNHCMRRSGAVNPEKGNHHTVQERATASTTPTLFTVLFPFRSFDIWLMAIPHTSGYACTPP